MLVEQLRPGVSYRQFMAGLFLGGLRHFARRLSALHCVYVLHAAHQLSLDARPQHRLLPLFLALDSFKGYQSRRGWYKSAELPLLSGAMPAASNARAEFHAAMQDWDAPRADRALVMLLRICGVNEIADVLFPYGARDWRNDGHMAIFTANAWRTLDTIGWQHAEVLLRSIAHALMSFGSASDRVSFQKQPYAANVERARQTLPRLPADWAAAQPGGGPTDELLATLRKGQIEEACQLATKLLAEGKTRAGSIRDAVHVAAARIQISDGDFRRHATGRPPMASAHVGGFGLLSARQQPTRLTRHPTRPYSLGREERRVKESGPLRSGPGEGVWPADTRHEFPQRYQHGPQAKGYFEKLKATTA